MNEGQESMWFIFVLAWVSRKLQNVLINEIACAKLLVCSFVC